MRRLLYILSALFFIGLPLHGASYDVTVDGVAVEQVQFRDITYILLDGDKTRSVVISSESGIKSCEVSPVFRNVSVTLSHNGASFTLPSAGWWVARLDEGKRIFFLIDKEAHAPSRKTLLATDFQNLQQALDKAAGSGKTLVIPAGDYVTGALTIHSNTDVWIEKDAVIRASGNPADYPADEGCLEADKVHRPESYSDNGERMTFSRLILIEGSNISLRGRGTLDGNGTVLRAQGKPSNLIRVRNSSNVLIEGLVLRNPAAWNTHILHSDNVTLRDLKIINDPNVPNTDGIDPDSSTKVLVDHCFAYCSDDNIAVKSTNNSGLLKDVDDILVKDCVFLTRKSSLKVGTETKARAMRNIRFMNNDVVECDRAFALYCNDGAAFSNILYENNRVERNWPDSQRKLIHFKVSKRFGEGSIDGVTIRGCKAYYPFPRRSVIDGLDANHRIDNVVFENCEGFDWETPELVPYKDFSYAITSREVPFVAEIDCGSPVKKADVSPHSRKIKAHTNGSKVSFEVASYGQYCLNADGRTYYLFADKPAASPEGVSIMSYKKIDASGRKDITASVQKAINECARSGRTLIFPAGTYLCKQLSIPSGASIHLEEGAVIKANPGSWEYFVSRDDVATKRFINIKDASHIRITGQGAIDGSGSQLRESFEDKARMRLLMAINSSDILIEGVMLRDPGSWNSQILLCSDVTFRNVKLLNDMQISNTDGFDPDASTNVLIENCFARCSDDNVAIKTTGYSGYLGDVDGIVVRGCVFITKKSSLKIGTETRGSSMKNIVFEDNDVLMSDRGMAVYVADGAHVENVLYTNNRFENYTEKGKMTGFEFSVKKRKADSPVGSISGLVIRDCSYEKSFPKESSIKGLAESEPAIQFINLSIAGKKIESVKQGKIAVSNSKVTFE
ncbi:MAG: right-handed parallel beta-helix repeat-containing protein [Bacteroidales bacterium]|nr:right-handed parallel beta-helix repeat-containing protein [Bacteroidales bacterium]